MRHKVCAVERLHLMFRVEGGKPMVTVFDAFGAGYSSEKHLYSYLVEEGEDDAVIDRFGILSDKLLDTEPTIESANDKASSFLQTFRVWDVDERFIRLCLAIIERETLNRINYNVKLTPTMLYNEWNYARDRRGVAEDSVERAVQKEVLGL